MPAPLHPLLTGVWNGHSLWLQWDPAQDAAEGYRLELAVRSHPDEERVWQLYDAGRTPRHWRVIPIWKTGAIVEARVSVNGRPGLPETARECQFQRNTCVFCFQSVHALRYPAGSNFHAMVDGAPCSYLTEQEIELPAGELVRATLQALSSGGFMQLDAAGDFTLRPSGGVRIWNAGPSENDVRLTGRDFTVLSVRPLDGPLAVVKCEPLPLRAPVEPHNPDFK